MHLEILPPSRPESRDSLISDLEQGLLEVLRLVEDAVQDWQKMITRSEDTIEMLKDPALIAGHADQAALACELLSWLNANHFTFLGYREYDVRSDQSGIQFKARPATGLGILRADQDPPGMFHAIPRPDVEPELMIITKDNQKSRVHRPVYLDYIAFRIFDSEHVSSVSGGSSDCSPPRRTQKRGPDTGAAAEGRCGDQALRLQRVQPWWQGDHGRARELSPR